MKKVVIKGRVYLEQTNRTPIMVLVGDRICSLETVLKESGVFEYIEPRTVTKKFSWDKSGMSTYETTAKVTKADIEGQFKPVKITLIMED